MKIVDENEQLCVEHDNQHYIRYTDSEGKIQWSHVDIHILKSKQLEKLYQELINKPVETTNEQPVCVVCECERDIIYKKNMCKSCYDSQP